MNATIATQQQQAAQYKAQSDTLQSRLGFLGAQSAEINAKLRLNRAKQAQTTARIQAAQKELVAKKLIMDESVRQIYQHASVSPLEMLVSVRSFSDFVDKQQYQDEIKEHIQDASTAIQKLKADLEKQQADLSTLISQQSGLAAALQQQQAEAANLLAETQGNEAAYQTQIKSNGEKVAQLRAQQAAAIAARSRGAVRGNVPGASNGRGGACDNGYGNGGYPMKWCDAPQDALVDNWGMYTRECVSWAAWRRSQVGRPVPGGWGNAKEWDDRARAAGFRVDGSPERHAVGVINEGRWGHVVVVEQVLGDNVLVSEMNYDVAGHFRHSYYPTNSLIYIH